MKAFTLIELLVTAAIIAVLLAIISGPLTSAREQARRVACAVRLRDLWTQTQAYAMDYPHQPDNAWTMIDHEVRCHGSPYTYEGASIYATMTMHRQGRTNEHGPVWAEVTRHGLAVMDDGRVSPWSGSTGGE